MHKHTTKNNRSDNSMTFTFCGLSVIPNPTHYHDYSFDCKSKGADDDTLVLLADGKESRAIIP